MKLGSCHVPDYYLVYYLFTFEIEFERLYFLFEPYPYSNPVCKFYDFEFNDGRFPTYVFITKYKTTLSW